MTDALARSMSEEQLLQAITDAATLYGWKWHHVRRSDKALQMGDAGFPDLVLARSGRVIFLELKRASGVVSPDQVAWLEALEPEDGTVRNPRAHLVRPVDLDALLVALR